MASHFQFRLQAMVWPRGPAAWLPTFVGALALLAVVAFLLIHGRNDGRDVTGASRPGKQSAAVLSTAPEMELEEKIQVVLQAEGLEDAQRRYSALFKAAGVAGLPALKRHQHDGIAIQAAWEEVLLTVPKNPESGGLRVEKLEWFLGFLRRRLRVQPPQEWADILCDARANHRYNVYFQVPKQYHPAGLDWLRSQPGTTLKREGSKVVLAVGDQSATVPEDLFPTDTGGELWSQVNGLMTPRRCYVAVHTVYGDPYKLTCIDRASDKVLWKSPVWAVYYIGSSTGVPGYSWVGLTEHDGRVIVFGVAGYGIYVEAFRADNGANLFRFTGGTDYARWPVD